MRVISGSAKGISLKTPKGMTTRPTADRVKEALFSIIQFDIPGAKVLDLFGGTGQLGIEALSRGAKSAVFVDESQDACSLIRENLNTARLYAESQVIRSDYMNYLNHCHQKFDLIFLDPPYAEVFLENAIKTITQIDILQTDGIIVCERPYGKVLNFEESEYARSRDYKYGSTVLTVFRKK